MPQWTWSGRNLLTAGSFLFMTVPLFAQDKPPDVGHKPAAAAENADALRKAAQNPVASLNSVPVQENWNFGIGPSDRIQNVLNVQPVIPVNVAQNWNLIIRWVTPIIYQPIGVQAPPPPSGGDPPAIQSGIYGFGDMQPQRCGGREAPVHPQINASYETAETTDRHRPAKREVPPPDP